MQMSLPAHWNIERIINQLDEFGFYILDAAYSTEYLNAVRLECMSHLESFRQAAIQNGVVSNIRSDHILWLDDTLCIAQQHTQCLMALAQQLNRVFFLGIKDIEAHFACYNAGEFYALHRDNPQEKNGRIVSSVFYLHEAWQNDFGGELRLQDKQGHWHIVQPMPNRIVIFQSNLLHEVLLSKQQRLSITGWLRSDIPLI
ncbi:2OG-Fe(II) oxygenase [Acinetobacter sp. HY1485]|uniref:2OG-Fe(II) oxygenase n=1 Tax=Acinetobacter sp. HY1485 TaxID=2970918 RepID=UPI0022B98D54|nr:2OG-Fe(II) oxygenase [Acinetobacter sp. HY1485]